METYPRAAVERAMKLQEVILRALAKKITWEQAAEIVGISDRHGDDGASGSDRAEGCLLRAVQRSRQPFLSHAENGSGGRSHATGQHCGVAWPQGASDES